MKLAIFGILFVIAAVSANDGSISVYNSGGYVAKFSLQYDLNGERKSDNSGNFGLGVTKSLNIPEAASNIYLIVEEYWFPGSLSTIFTKSFSEPVHQCYKIWGTTLNPSYDAINC